jgi:outer membrane lipoprotein-sorting protein
MELVGYQLYLDQYWRADQMVMTNNQNGKTTTLNFNDYQFRIGLTDKDFSRGALSRFR